MATFLFGVITLTLSSIAVVSSFPTNVGIVGGHNTTIEDHPWLVSVWQEHPEPKFYCAGFIVSPFWVVTTAVCLLGNVSFVRAGSDSYQSGGVIAYIGEEIVHPGFDILTLDTDLALLHLTTALSGGIIRPAILPIPDNISIASGDTFTVAGWGSTEPQSSILSDTLLEVNVLAVSNEDCNAIYGNVPESYICGGGSGIANKSTCEGDQGSPVFWNGVPVALVSNTHYCGSDRFPAMFTNLVGFINWIEKIIREN